MANSPNRAFARGAPSSSAVGTAKKSASPVRRNGEKFADDLRAKGVAYINVDESTSGPNFTGEAVASLAPMLENNANLEDPIRQPVYHAWKARSNGKAKKASTGASSTTGVSGSTLADTRIGSGSDHTVSLNFIGVPVLGLGSTATTASTTPATTIIYWMTDFGDPGYRYHTAHDSTVGRNGAAPRQCRRCSPSDFATYACDVRPLRE